LIDRTVMKAFLRIKLMVRGDEVCIEGDWHFSSILEKFRSDVAVWSPHPL